MISKDYKKYGPFVFVGSNKNRTKNRFDGSFSSGTNYCWS
jgi:hypothetical protein